MSDSKRLTGKQEAFCRYYVSNGFNATQAAVSAGYSEDTANEQGARLLANVSIKDFIEELKKPIAKKTTMSAERLAQMVNECLEFDLTEWFDLVPPTLDETGKVLHRGGLMLKCSLSDLPESIRKVMIQGWKQTKYGTEVSLVSKQFLLDMQARFLSMYKDTVTIRNEGELTPEEMEELEAFRLKQDKTDAPPTP